MMGRHTSTVRSERDGVVTIVTIDRPAVRNAVDGARAAALAEAFRRFEADDGFGRRDAHGRRADLLRGCGSEETFRIKGVLNSGPGKPSNDVIAFRKMMGFQGALILLHPRMRGRRGTMGWEHDPRRQVHHRRCLERGGTPAHPEVTAAGSAKGSGPV